MKHEDALEHWWWIAARKECTAEFSKISNAKGSIQKGVIPPPKIWNMISEDKLFTGNELIDEGLLSMEKLDRSCPKDKRMTFYRKAILSYVSSSLEDDNELFYTHQDVLKMYNNGVLDRADLQSAIPDDVFQEMFPKEHKIDFAAWRDIPEPQDNRISIFSFGKAGSGKTVFLAGMLHYLYNIKGAVASSHVSHHLQGFDYTYSLLGMVEKNVFPPSTAPTAESGRENQYIMQYVEIDVVEKVNRQGFLSNLIGRRRSNNRLIHPLTFIEVGGEMFSDAYENKLQQDNIPDKLNKYLFNSHSNKYIFLTIDYEDDNAREQDKLLSFLLGFLEERSMMDTVEGIALIVTKWDLSPDKSSEGFTDFLNNKYKNLLKKCEGLSEEYGVSFHRFRYSIGQLTRFGKTYKKDENYEAYSEKVYQLLLQTSVKPTGRQSFF